MSLEGTVVLVVEDEPLIAMDLAETLANAGATVVGPVGRVTEALFLLGRTPVDAAILDVTLGHEDIAPVAEVLATRQIPFVFVTGGLRGKLAGNPYEAPVILKPAPPQRVVEQLAMELARRHTGR